MVEKQKIVRDPIHGNIKFKGVFHDLLETPEIQRLYHIKQLGFAHLVFPGAHHTRLEHSLGTFKIAVEATNQLNLNKQEKDILCCASLLHDIGHGPFSHTLESILRDSLNVDHVDLTKKILLNKIDIFLTDEKQYIKSPSVYDILEKYNIDTKIVANTISGTNKNKPYLNQLLNSTVDVDQLDYLIRDAYYTGVSYGLIDIERFLQTLTLYDNNLGIKKKGI